MKYRSHRMRRVVLGLSIALLLAWAAPASAQVRLEIVPPSLRFEVRPPLVVVSPGIEVVPEHDHEVFLVGGLWWTRHEGHWYRSRHHDGHWERVKHSVVPVRLRDLPPGKYKHWKARKAEAKARDKRDKSRRKHAQKDRGHGGRHKKKKGKGK